MLARNSGLQTRLVLVGLVAWAISLLLLSWLLGFGGFELGLLSIPFIVVAALRWGIRGGLLAAAWASGVMVLAGLFLATVRLYTVHLTVSLVAFAGLGLGLGRYVEVLARHRAELAASESRLNRAQAISGTGSWEWDRATGRWLWSEQMYSLMGLNPIDCPASHDALMAQIHVDDRDAVRHAHALSIQARGVAQEHEYRLVDSKTNQVRYILEKCEHLVGANGHPLRSTGTVQDITARKDMEQTIERLLQDYESVFNGTYDAIFLVEVLGDGMFRYARTNVAHVKLTGIATQAIQHKTPQELLGEDNGRLIAANYQRCLDHGEPITYEETIALPGGRRVWETTLTPVYREQGTWICGASRDITGYKHARDALLEREAQLQAILQSTADGILATSRDGRLLAANDRFYELWQMPSELVGSDSNERLKEHAMQRLVDPQAWLERLAVLWASTDEAHDTHYLTCGGVLERYSRPLSVDGSLQGRVWSFRDVTERSQHEQQLVQLSLHDQLTGVHNRAYFVGELHRLAKSAEYPISLISIDLDGLKLVNDTVGHERGDELLATCARVLRASLRATDALARVGGDEFAVVLPRTGTDDAQALLERVRTNLDKHNSQHPGLPVILSMGAATAFSDETPLEGVLKLADAQMYRDKLERSPEKSDLILGGLLSPLDNPDRVCEGQAERLSELCLELGLKLKMPDDQLTDMLLLARVHDLGMVGVPEAVIFEDRPLSAAEWDLVSLHPETGYRIALASRDLAGVAELILRHHERWDGAGYPAGLKGEEIPLPCRVFALADAYEAITHDRPFRPARTAHEALWEIKSCSGGQFDPAVVAAFVELIEADRPEGQDSGVGRVISLHDRRSTAGSAKQD